MCGAFDAAFAKLLWPLVLNCCFIVFDKSIVYTCESVSRQYQHELWLRREAVAQAAFLAKKDRQEKERIRREEEEVCLSRLIIFCRILFVVVACDHLSERPCLG